MNARYGAMRSFLWSICVKTQNSHVLTNESFALTHVTSVPPHPHAIEMAGCWLLRSPGKP